MKNKIICLFLIITILFVFTGCNKNNKINYNENNLKDIKEVSDNVKVIIDEKEYLLNIEDNETSKAFIKLLPQEFTMNDLNNNEKYIYLDKSLPTNSYQVGQINKGDVMLFGDNCLVIFYKSFDTSYSYTKIGHIDNLPDFDSNNISVRFEK